MRATQAAPVKRGPGRPRTGPDPERVRQIMTAAAELFRQKGYAATSMQDIADANGLLKGSIYHYVDSKEDFLYQVIGGVYAEAIADIQKVVELDAAPEIRLAAFAQAHVMFTTTHITAYTVRLREFHNLSEAHRHELRHDGEGYRQVLTDILADGRRSGVFDDALDLDLQVQVLLGQLNSVTRWYDEGAGISPEALVDQVVSLTVSSVISDRGAKAHKGVEKLRADVRAVII